MKNLMITLFSFVVITLALPASAADAAAGKEITTSCTGCHGMKGISQAGMFPNLAGQNAEYLEIALKAYRDGDREDSMMTPMARGLSNEDIADIAAYFSSLKAN